MGDTFLWLGFRRRWRLRLRCFRVIECDVGELSAVRAANRFPALIEKRQQTLGATCYQITRLKNFMRDRISTLRLKKFLMARLAQNCCSTAHENETLFVVLL